MNLEKLNWDADTNDGNRRQNEIITKSSILTKSQITFKWVLVRSFLIGHLEMLFAVNNMQFKKFGYLETSRFYS